MKIFETEDDGKIGDLLYKTVEFTRRELVAGGVGVISQGAVQRYLEAAKPNLKIKKCGSFKLDSQEDTVTMRIGIANTKLLNPGYDELKARYDELKEASDEYITALTNNRDALEKKYNAGVSLRNKLVDDVVESEKQLLALQTKFSDLLVENEELKNRLTKLQKEILNGVIAGPGPEPEGEPELADGKPDCDGSCENCENHACDIDEIDGLPEIKNNIVSGGIHLPDRFEKEESDSNTE